MKKKNPVGGHKKTINFIILFCKFSLSELIGAT